MTRRLAQWLLILLVWSSPAAADVTITFYSHGSGLKWSGFLSPEYQFPHAYIVAKGSLDGGAEPVNTDFGFGSKIIDPRAYLGPVEGEVYVKNTTDEYLKESVRHLSLTVDDAGYRKVLQIVAEWQEDPVYEIDDHNCITFVGEIAQNLNLKISTDPKFKRDPEGFLADLASENPGVVAASDPISVASAPGE